MNAATDGFTCRIGRRSAPKGPIGGILAPNMPTVEAESAENLDRWKAPT